MGKVVSKQDVERCYPLSEGLSDFVPNRRILIELGGRRIEYLVEVYTLDGIFWARTPDDDPVFASAPNASWQCLTGPGRVTKVEPVSYREEYVRPANRDGVVYYIAQGSHVKIGWTQDVTRRMGELQVSAPEPLKLLGTEPGTQQTEKDRHAQFDSLRGSGEWFRRAELLEAHLKTL